MIEGGSPQDPSRRRRAVIGVALVVGALQLTRFADPRWAIDDAWVSFRYARMLALHGSLTFDPSLPPVEGMTNLLWTLLAAGWIRLAPEADPIWGARLLGAACHLATIATAALLAARIADRRGSSGLLAAGATGLVLASSGSLAFFALSGLETPLWTLLFVVTLARWEASWQEPAALPRAISVGVLAGLLAATRPEGVLVGAFIVVASATAPRLRWRAVLGIAIPLGVTVAALEAFRLLWFGELVPNTFHAKPGVLRDGMEYVASFVVFGTGFVGLAATIPALKTIPRLRAVAVLGVVLAAGTAWSGGDWMPGFRRLALPTCAAGLLCGVGLAVSRGGWRALAGGALAAMIIGSAVTAWTGQDRIRQAPWEARAIAVAANETPDVTVVALADIGRFGYFFDGGIFDLVGLTDRHIASLPGLHGDKVWDEAYFRAANPALVLARSEDPIVDPLPHQPRIGTTEHDVVLSILDRGGYRYHASWDLGLDRGRYLLLFVRDDVVLPTKLWGPPPAKDLRDLLQELGR